MPSLPLFIRRAISCDFYSTSAIAKYCFLFVAFIAICVAFAFIPSHLLWTESMDFTAPTSPISASVMLSVELISIDIESRTLVMDWYARMPACTPLVVANIYLDPSYLDHASSSFSDLKPYPPAYQYNNSDFCYWGIQIDATFRTISKLEGSRLPNLAAQRSTTNQFPFDKYTAKFGLYAVNNETGVGMPVNITHSSGMAPNFHVSVDWAFTAVYNTSHGPQPQLQFTLQITRSRIIQFFMISISVVCWLLILAMGLITATVLVYPLRKFYPKAPLMIVSVALGLLFVRVNLPGAPHGLGTKIDTFTILPAVIILGVCTFFLLLVVLRQEVLASITEEQKPKTV